MKTTLLIGSAALLLACGSSVLETPGKSNTSSTSTSAGTTTTTTGYGGSTGTCYIGTGESDCYGDGGGVTTGYNTSTGYGGCYYGSGTSSYGDCTTSGYGGYGDEVSSVVTTGYGGYGGDGGGGGWGGAGGIGGGPAFNCQNVPNLAPVGNVVCDGGSVGSGMGPVACEIDCHDQDGAGFETFCQGNVCQCEYNFQVYCECVNVEPACGGGKTCCPSPWIAP